jgi:hypothetical protein
MDSPPRHKSGFAPAGTGTKPEMSKLEGDDHNNMSESFDTSKLRERTFGIYLCAVFDIPGGWKVRRIPNILAGLKIGGDVERGRY